MTVVNPDALYLVAKYLEPDPILYYRLASVSKAFYAAFTSDMLWQYINSPFGPRAGRFSHFSDASLRDRYLYKLFSGKVLGNTDFCKHLVRNTTNKYVLACEAAQHNGVYTDLLRELFKDRNFMLCALGHANLRDRQALYRASGLELQRDLDFYIACQFPWPTEATFQNATAESVMKLIRAYSDSEIALDESWVRSIPHDLVLNHHDIQDALGSLLYWLLLDVPLEVAEQWVDEHPELVSMALRDLRFHLFFPIVQAGLTKEVIIKEASREDAPHEPIQWEALYRETGRTFFGDLAFMAQVAKYGAGAGIPIEARMLGQDWLEGISKVLSLENYSAFMNPNETPFLDRVVLHPTQYSHYLTLEYFRSVASNLLDKDLLLSVFSEKQYIQMALKMNQYLEYRHISAEALDDRDLALQLVKRAPRLFAHLKEEFKNEPEFFEAICEYDLDKIQEQCCFKVMGTETLRGFDLSKLPLKWLTHPELPNFMQRFPIFASDHSTYRHMEHNLELLTICIQQVNRPADVLRNIFLSDFSKDQVDYILGAWTRIRDRKSLFTWLAPLLIEWKEDHEYINSIAAKHGLLVPKLLDNKLTIALSISRDVSTLRYFNKYKGDMRFMSELATINPDVFSFTAFNYALRIFENPYYLELSPRLAWASVRKEAEGSDRRDAARESNELEGEAEREAERENSLEIIHERPGESMESPSETEHEDSEGEHAGCCVSTCSIW